MHEAVVELLRGNAEHAAAYRSRFEAVQEGQRPAAVTVSCADSRVLGHHMWGNDEPGRLFSCSNIGNRVVQRSASGVVVSGDVLYPLVHAGTEVVVVAGHTGCGAVTATYDAVTGEVSEPAGIEHCLALLEPDIAPGVERLPPDLPRGAAVNRLVEYNVDRQVEHLVGSDDVPPDVTVVGVVYDFQDVYPGLRGEVHVVTVDGERAVERLRDEHPAVEDRIERLWEY